MIGQDEIRSAFEEHVEAIVQGVETAGVQNAVWAIYAALEVDPSALAETAVAWARLGGGNAAWAAQEAQGFEAGFLVALRLGERSEAE